jgi:hypothetical protein
MSEKPVRLYPRRPVDWINPTEGKKDHSLINQSLSRYSMKPSSDIGEKRRRLICIYFKNHGKYKSYRNILTENPIKLILSHLEHPRLTG